MPEEKATIRRVLAAALLLVLVAGCDERPNKPRGAGPVTGVAVIDSGVDEVDAADNPITCDEDCSVVELGTETVGQTMRWLGASVLRTDDDELSALIEAAGTNLSKYWLPLVDIERTLLPGEVYGRPTREEILADPEAAINWDNVAHWYGGPKIPDQPQSSLGNSLIKHIDARRALGIEAQVISIYPRQGSSNCGRWGCPAPGCPTTEEDWHEWWRGCFVMAYYLNVKMKKEMRYWEIGSEPHMSIDMSWRRRDGKEGSAEEMNRLVREGADAIRSACRYAGVEPVIIANGETMLRQKVMVKGSSERIRPPLYWWRAWVADPLTSAYVDGLSIHTFGYQHREKRVQLFDDLVAFSLAHPQPFEGKPAVARKIWDTSWRVRRYYTMITDTREIGNAVQTLAKIVDENNTGFFDASVLFQWVGTKPTADPPKNKISGLILKDNAESRWEPTRTYYALRMAARAVVSGKELLELRGLPLGDGEIPEAATEPYENYEPGEAYVLGMASRDDANLFITLLNATPTDRTLMIDLSAHGLDGKEYLLRELSAAKNDQQVDAGRIERGSLRVVLAAASALQLQIRR